MLKWQIVSSTGRENERFKCSNGSINVRSADKRTATTSTAAPRKQQLVNTPDEALDVMAQFLADETD